MKGTTAGVAIVIVAVTLAVPGYGETGGPATVLNLSANETGEQTAAAPFALDLSKLAILKFTLKLQPGTLRVTCAWERNIPLSINVTGSAGHGLPGRVSLGGQNAPSPVSLEVQVTPEQASRGTVSVEIAYQPYPPPEGFARGTLTISFRPSESPENNDDESADSALEEGRLLSPSEVVATEAKLKINPHDWSARLSLLAYYSSSAVLQMSKPQVIAARRRHLLWTIENRPSSSGLFEREEFQLSSTGRLADLQGAEEAEGEWQKAIEDHPNDRQIIVNAVWFCAPSDPAFSEHTLELARSRTANDVVWSRQLGLLYASALSSGNNTVFTEHALSTLKHSQDADLVAAGGVGLSIPRFKINRSSVEIQPGRPAHLDFAEDLASRSISLSPSNPFCLLALLQVLGVEVVTTSAPDQRAIAEKKAFGLFQYFDDLTIDHGQRAVVLPALAELAFDLEDDPAATKYATQAVEFASEPNSAGVQSAELAEAIHNANDVLGRVALRSGDVASADEYLVKAATMPQGTMNVAGPSMDLCQALLDRGERESVLRYLEALKRTWLAGEPRLDGWIASISKGQKPRLNRVDSRGIPVTFR